MTEFLTDIVNLNGYFICSQQANPYLLTVLMHKFRNSHNFKPNAPFIHMKIELKEFKLENGLSCVMHKNSDNPIVSVNVGYKVGSKDEAKGLFGIAHLFEHMMFQGSENVKKNEHFGNVQKSGGTCNAFTMNDATVYFDTLPAGSLETALWLESDRMNKLDINTENLENQKSVVLEEKKQVFDNAPYGTMMNNIFKNVFKGSGYEHPVIGVEDDIKSFTVEGATDFHYRYYSPCNAVLVITGDIDYQETESLVRKYFGGLRKKCDIPRISNNICALNSNVDETHYDNIQLPAFNLCYQIPKAGSHSVYALEYFSEIMANSESSRLYKKYVYEAKVLQSVNIANIALHDSGILIIRGFVSPGVNVEEVKANVIKDIEDFAQNGCSGNEFEKVRNWLDFSSTAKHLTMQNIAIETVFNCMYFNDPDRINSETDRYLAVTTDDVVSAVRDYIVEGGRVSVDYLPKNGQN